MAAPSVNIFQIFQDPSNFTVVITLFCAVTTVLECRKCGMIDDRLRILMPAITGIKAWVLITLDAGKSVT